MKNKLYKSMSIIIILMISFSFKSVYASEKNTAETLEYIQTQALNIYIGTTRVFNKNNIDITNDFIRRFPTQSHLNNNALNEILNERYALIEDLSEEDNYPYNIKVDLYGLVNHSYSKKVTQTTSTYPHELLQGKTEYVTISYYIRGTVTEDTTTKKIINFSSPVVNLAYSNVSINKFYATTSAPTYILPGNYGINISTSVNFMYLFEGLPGLEIPVRALRYSFAYYPSAQ